jgi:hypothetical protein
MKRDSQIALALTGLSLLLLTSSVRIPVLSVSSSPLVALLFLATIVMLYVEGYVLVSIVLIAVGLYLVRGYSVPVTRENYTYTPPPTELAAPIPEQPVSYGPDSVDLDIANRRVSSHVASEVYDVQPALLTHPPSYETLWSMTGG